MLSLEQLIVDREPDEQFTFADEVVTESLVGSTRLPPERKFAAAVSDRAIYFYVGLEFVSGREKPLRRMPLGEVTGVSCTRRHDGLLMGIGIALGAGLMVIVANLVMRVSPAANVVAGALVMVALLCLGLVWKTRLAIHLRDGKALRWTDDKRSRTAELSEQYARVVEGFVEACQRVGVPVTR